jgi:hypothetical protein
MCDVSNIPTIILAFVIFVIGLKNPLEAKFFLEKLLHRKLLAFVKVGDDSA